MTRKTQKKKSESIPYEGQKLLELLTSQLQGKEYKSLYGMAGNLVIYDQRLLKKKLVQKL